jgi:hypothetical protein
MSARRSLRRTLLAAALVLPAACHDLQPTSPLITAPTPGAAMSEKLVALQCRMEVALRSLTCATDKPSTAKAGFLGDRVIGNQDVYIKMASSGTAYDAGTEILSSNVTLQNLSRFSMGTTDGFSITPIRVFFHQQPTVLSGTGVVTLANADGTDTFTGSAQPYFQYNQMVAPYEISASRGWQFNVPSTVGTFNFGVYVSAPQTDEIGTLLDRVWQGASSTAWLTDANWSNGTAPDSTSTVAIPSDSLIVGAHSQPALTADATIANLRVGYGSTLDLGGHILTVDGIVDAVGPITNGTTLLASSVAVLSGTVNVLEIRGDARLQRPTVATGPVNVSGKLNVADQTLTINIP